MTPTTQHELVIIRDIRRTARAGHANEADREAHEEMGFAEGRGRCTSQPAELAATLS